MAKTSILKLYYTISEVSKLIGIKQYVLRYWETEFPSLSPLKTSSGQRKYRQTDIDHIRQIKQLLYEESYTIAGAKKKLREERLAKDKKQDLISLLKYTKKELRTLLTQLNKET